MTRRSVGAPSYEDVAARLADAEAALEAIAAGAVDALASGHGADAEILALTGDDGFFVTLVTEMQEATASLDANGTLLYANPRFAELLGIPLSGVVGRTLAELTAQDGQAAARRLLAQAARGPARGTLELVGGDGRLVPVSASAAPIAGERPEVCLVATDLTERRQVERTLREAQERFRCSFEEALIGMMVIGLDGRYECVNDAFCAIVGHTQEQLEGLSRESITHPDDHAADAAAQRTLVAGEATSHCSEKRYLHASGHAVWAAINLTLIRDVTGQPLHFIAQVQDITERRRYEGQLEHMADHDPLTGLLNRRSFARELESHAARVQRYGVRGSVLMLDLDHFKYFNDSQGHSAGDQLIVRIAQGLRSRLRDSDVIARLGGDEFAILLPSADEQETRTVAEALLGLVRDEAMPVLIGEHRRVTASIGIARFDDGERLTAEELMVNADLAMYDAKEAGRDRWARYRTEEHARPKIESRMKWSEQINDAIAHDRFELLAQPIVPLAGGAPDQYELLVRMRDRHGDLIPPGSFLYVAERLGLIREIDHWVAHRAIDMLAEQRAQGRDLRFAVNLSGHTIGDRKLLELIERRLRETGVPADRLIFEITETAAVAHIGRAAAFVQSLSGVGCEFALDDFGAGFGSFYYLKHLPFDYLKIDGEFVRHCAANETDRILISAVVQIARGMGKRTVAEFVHSAETVEVLTRLGVDYGQGFHLGRPAPLSTHLAALDAVSDPARPSVVQPP